MYIDQGKMCDAISLSVCKVIFQHSRLTDVYRIILFYLHGCVNIATVYSF